MQRNTYTTNPCSRLPEHFLSFVSDFCIYTATVEKNIAMDQLVDKKRKGRSYSCWIGKHTVVYKNPLTQELENDGLSFSGGQLQREILSHLFYEDYSFLIMNNPPVL